MLNLCPTRPVPDPQGQDVGVSLHLHEDCLGVGEAGPVSQAGAPVTAHHPVQLLLHLLLDPRVPGEEGRDLPQSVYPR